MKLDLLPVRAGGAAENMATDFLLLQRYPAGAHARFRHYDWRRPAFTFGLSQKIEFVRAQLSSFDKASEGKASGLLTEKGVPSEALAKEGLSGDCVELCRRPTGGGVVDHRDDWTYTLVIPRGHPLHDERATQSYRVIHEALATALRAQGIPAVLKAKPGETATGSGESSVPGVCFQRAEVYDVLHGTTGDKIAGAAQKRNKNGLLFQGSLWRPAVGAVLDCETLHDAFTAELARALAASAEPTPWPDFAEDELSALIEQYSSPEWNEYR